MTLRIIFFFKLSLNDCEGKTAKHPTVECLTYVIGLNGIPASILQSLTEYPERAIIYFKYIRFFGHNLIFTTAFLVV